MAHQRASDDQSEGHEMWSEQKRVKQQLSREQ